jgi:hypothetical protein
MDFSFEKTNSAYMLFYERIPKRPGEAPNESISAEEPKKFNFDLSVELAEVKIAINLILKYCNPLTFAV